MKEQEPFLDIKSLNIKSDAEGIYISRADPNVEIEKEAIEELINKYITDPTGIISIEGTERKSCSCFKPPVFINLSELKQTADLPDAERQEKVAEFALRLKPAQTITVHKKTKEEAKPETFNNQKALELRFGRSMVLSDIKPKERDRTASGKLEETVIYEYL